MLNSRKSEWFNLGFFLQRRESNVQQDMNREILIEFLLRLPIDNHLDHLRRIDEVHQGYFLLTYLIIEKKRKFIFSKEILRTSRSVSLFNDQHRIRVADVNIDEKND